jgi:hypothetical protein
MRLPRKKPRRLVGPDLAIRREFGEWRDRLDVEWRAWRESVTDRYQLADGDEVADDGTIRRV